MDDFIKGPVHTADKVSEEMQHNFILFAGINHLDTSVPATLRDIKNLINVMAYKISYLEAKLSDIEKYVNIPSD